MTKFTDNELMDAWGCPEYEALSRSDILQNLRAVVALCDEKNKMTKTINDLKEVCRRALHQWEQMDDMIFVMRDMEEVLYKLEVQERMEKK
jgi:hypothetical protein